MKEHLFQRCRWKGGGGSSGAVSYPAYLEAIHVDWLGGTISQRMNDTMNTAFAASPFTGVSAYSPATPIADIATALTALGVVNTSLDYLTDFAAMTAALSVDPGIAAEVVAYNAEVDWNLTNIILPRFQRGMQDINAVYSSSFVLGEALIESQGTIQKAKFASEIRNRFMFVGLGTLADMWKFEGDFHRMYTSVVIEASRIKMVALKEQADRDLQIDESDAKWDLEVFAHGANLIAAISGGTSHAQGAKASPIASALGGAMSGAAMGSMVSPGYGTAIGAVIGGIGGYMSAQ